MIFKFAFTGEAAVGGSIGAQFVSELHVVYSQTKRVLDLPLSHAAAARTDMPGRQALVSMTQVLFDTLVICSITGITIVMSGQWKDTSIEAGALTSAAFGEFLGGAGPIVVSIGLIFFATSTIFGWGYYGEKCFQYLFPNITAVRFYRLFFVLFIFVGATASLDVIWALADVLNGLMAIPNLIGLLGLSGVIIYETKRVQAKIKEEQAEAKSNKS